MEGTSTQEQHVSLGRSRSISYAHGRGRRHAGKGSLIKQTNSSNDILSETVQDDDRDSSVSISIHAPLHSTISTDSVATRASLSTAVKGDLFHQSVLNSETIPGNIHMSSNSSIEHLIKRYGSVKLIRQLATDLAQREAELSLMRKTYSRKENALIKLLQMMGFTTSQIDSLVKEKMESQDIPDDESFLKDLIYDAMEDGIVNDDRVSSTSKESSIAVSPINSRKTPKSGSTSSFEDNDATITPKVKTRPHSLSSPPIPKFSSSPTHSTTSPNDQSHYDTILDVVSATILNRVPQPVHDAIGGHLSHNRSNHKSHNIKLAPVEMENFNSRAFGDPPATGDKDEYVDQFGFLYDNKQKRQSRGSGSIGTVNGSSITSKLLEIANDYDKSQQQTGKDWDDFIKKVTLLDKDSTGDWLSLNGKGIRHHKNLNKTFTKLIQNGIPMKYRPKVWSELSGSKHLVDPAEYQTLLHVTKPNTEAESQIELDLYRTMPFNVFFKDNGPGLAQLQRVLIAFSRKYRNIGYCQGMNFVVANLLLVYQNEEDAFWTFIALIENILPSGFFNLANIKTDLETLKRNFKEQMPKLSTHLADCDVELEPICFNWFMSLFTDSLSAHLVFRVWDNLMLNGYDEIHKTSIALFKISEERLLSMNDNVEIYEFMKNLNKANFNLKGSELIRISSSIKIE